MVWEWREWFGNDWNGLGIMGMVWEWREWFGNDWNGLGIMGMVWEWFGNDLGMTGVVYI